MSEPPHMIDAEPLMERQGLTIDEPEAEKVTTKAENTKGEQMEVSLALQSLPDQIAQIEMGQEPKNVEKSVVEASDPNAMDQDPKTDTDNQADSKMAETTSGDDVAEALEVVNPQDKSNESVEMKQSLKEGDTEGNAAAESKKDKDKSGEMGEAEKKSSKTDTEPKDGAKPEAGVTSSKNDGTEATKEKEPYVLPWDRGPDIAAVKDRERQQALRKKILSASQDALKKRPIRPVQEYLDDMALRYAKHRTPSKLGPDASPDEIIADNERRLAAPTTKHRRVFSIWPRDPQGKVLKPEESKLGKMLPNRIQFWGATLFDFFFVRRIPDCQFLLTISTGSKLLAWMKEQGETYATDQLEKAELEPYPQEVLPYPIAELLRELQPPTKASVERAIQAKNSPPKFDFGRSQPFVKLNPTPILQNRIPFHLLPKTLIVHDPFETLGARRIRSSPQTWDGKPDIVHVYRLQFSPRGEYTLGIDRSTAQIAREEEEIRTQKFLKNPTAETRPADRGVMFVPGGTKPGPCVPAVWFMHEARPEKRPVEEAHLYVAPDHLTGVGNHSFVYNVEWELPRSLLVDDAICKKCVYEKGMAILEAEDGPNGETKDPKWNLQTGKVVVSVEESPPYIVSAYTDGGEDVRDQEGNITTFELEPPSVTVTRKYLGSVRVINTGVEYQSPERGPLCEHLRSENTDPLTARVSVVAKMSLQYDEHLASESETYQEFPTHLYTHYTGYNILPPLLNPCPAGALVPQFYGYYVPDNTVAPCPFDRNAVEKEVVDVEQGMKVDTEEDASNDDVKMACPTGETESKEEIVKPNEDQEPAKNASDKDKDQPYTRYPWYRSPLLLIENCGKSICSIIDGMGIDDREECASLFYRLHHEGWAHNSAFTRNVLYQPGPINASPLTRVQNSTKRPDQRKTSFRLIDFGRSKRFKLDAEARAQEEMNVAKTLRVLHQDSFPS